MGLENKKIKRGITNNAYGAVPGKVDLLFSAAGLRHA
jgi:hypothetical protein